MLLRRRNHRRNRSRRLRLNARSHIHRRRRLHFRRNRCQSRRDRSNRRWPRWRCRNRRARRRRAFPGETHAPKSGNRFRKFQLHVSADITIIFRLHHLADDFFFRLVVRQKQQLSRGHRRAQPDHRAVVHHQHGLRRFRKWLALVAAFYRARAVHRHRHFQRHRLRLIRFFRSGRRSRSRSRDTRFEIFRSWRHRSAHLEG